MATESCGGDSLAPLRFLVVRVTVATALSVAREPLATVTGAAWGHTRHSWGIELLRIRSDKAAVDVNCQAPSESYCRRAWGAARRLMSSSKTALISLP